MSQLKLCSMDIVSGYYLPTVTYSKKYGVFCACDMCCDPDTLLPQVAIGPHDLHCLCNDCIRFALDDDRYDRALEARYPDIFNKQPNDYIPHSISPTNKEMHTTNGNTSWSDFVFAAARGAAGSNNPADRFAAASLGGAGLLGSALTYTSMQNMAKPLAELRDQFFPSGPTNKEMHSYNGNWDWVTGTVGTKVSDYYDVPKKQQRDRDFHKDMDTLFPGMGDQPKIHDVIDTNKNSRDRLKRITAPPGKDKPGKSMPIPPPIVSDIISHVEKKMPEIKDSPVLTIVKNELKKKQPDMNVVKGNLNMLVETYPQIRSLGPTNKEMHATNGNIYGPANKGVSKRENKKQLRKLKRKLNKAKGKASKPVVVKQTIRKSMPRKAKREIKKLTDEQRIANNYARFLRNPALPPPRLGSTGNTPTKILHGYYETTINMASTGSNFGSLTNATDLLIWLSPKMFCYYSSPTDFAAPVNIGIAVNGTTPFTNVASTSVILARDFINSTALQNESGATTNVNPGPLTRFLGGHVSIRCRCPVSTTAPPYIFGGLLPSQSALEADASNRVNPAGQLNQLSTTTIRTMPPTVEIDGMEGSAVYVPGNAVSLNFGSNVVCYGGSLMDNTAIPYLAMTGCPTTASVTVMFSAYFEIQQNVYNMNYGGWKLGPKQSTEDIFDHLPRINAVKERSLNLGARQAALGGFTIDHYIKPPVEKTVEQKMHDLRIELDKMTKLYKNLSVYVGEEEDEKFVSMSPPDSPKYTSLSRSTIDLALQLKDKLTPGSVTSKTIRNNLP